MGLLDFLQGDDAQLGLGLLAAGGPSTTQMSAGQRIAGAVRTTNELKDAQAAAKMKLLFQQSQIDENTSQNAQRAALMAQAQRQQAMEAGWLGGDSTAPNAGFVGGGTPGAGGSSGGVGASLPGAAGAPSGGKFDEWSRQFGIPKDALMADYLKNGGKGIAEMLNKAGGRDMKVSNGYAYDANKQGAGFLPQLNTSQNGQTSMVRIGADGLPVVGAPEGALGTYGAYQDASNRSGAAVKPIKIYNPVTQREEFSDERTVTGGQAQQGQPQSPAGYNTETAMRQTMQGDMGGDPKAAMREIATTRAQLASAPNMDPASRQMLEQHVAEMTRQLTNMGGRPAQSASGFPTTAIPGSGFAAGPSALDSASFKGREATASSIGAQAGTLLKDSADAANGAVQSVQSAQRMIAALDSDKVLSGPGASLRLKGMQIASTLGISGRDDAEKIANTRTAVQEMAKLTLAGRKQMSGQGAITNQESALAERATSGDIDSLTAPEIRQLAQAAERSGRFQYGQHDTKMRAMGQDPAMAGNVALYRAAPMPDGAGTNKPAGAMVASLPTANGSNQGKRMRNTETGKIMVSNGLQWREE